MSEDGRIPAADAASIPGEGHDTASLPGNHFVRGAQACREMMARFVEATRPEIATSIRLNWHPGWGGDPGRPASVVATWEPEPCPDGEANYAAYRDTDPDVEPDLELTATILENEVRNSEIADQHTETARIGLCAAILSERREIKL